MTKHFFDKDVERYLREKMLLLIVALHEHPMGSNKIANRVVD